MAKAQIEPHRITKPIQLLAVWMAGLVLLVSAFLTAAATITDPAWVPGLLTVAAVALVPLFIVLVFLMQTKFRPQLQEDAYYSKWLERQEEAFEDFEAETLQLQPEEAASVEESVGFEDLETERIKRYERHQGVFLVHTWRPSLTSGQVADVVIRLHQHGQGPLSAGLIDHVEYTLGPKFFSAPVVKTNASDSFRLEVSAYGPMLCLARVHLKDGASPFLMERYIDFEGAG